MLARDANLVFPVLGVTEDWVEGFPGPFELFHCFDCRIKELEPVGRTIIDSAGRRFRILSVLRGPKAPDTRRSPLGKFLRRFGVDRDFDVYEIDLELEEQPSLSWTEVCDGVAAYEREAMNSLYEKFEEDPELKEHLDAIRRCRSIGEIIELLEIGYGW